MNYLTIENISKSFGDRLLFKDVTIYVNQGDKVALVAKNGTGKTSLLHIIAAMESPDNGKVWLHPHIKTVFLSQEPDLSDHLSVFEEVYNSTNPIVKAISNYEYCLLNGSEKIQDAIMELDRLQGWNYEAKVKQILSVLEVDYLDQKIKSLSGGQKKRVALAKVLIDEPDFLILDEPTNHLDLEMIEWLQDYLSRSKITLLTVTHDRYFLDAICNQILELEHQQIYKYQGSYSQYVEKKAEREANLAVVYDKTKQLFKKELEWMRRQPQARGTKAKSRIDEFYDIEEKLKVKPEDDSLFLDIQMSRLGSKILELHNVSKTFNSKLLFKNLEYKFTARDRVGVIGRNGSGKSTLLDVITKHLEPDSGKVVHGDTLKIAYYTQKGMKLKEDKKAIDVVKDIAEYIPMNGGKKLAASQLMERFLFDGPRQQTFVSKLSGGEKRRLYLLTLLIANPNFLILDEPTNDLDIMTLQVLEEFLQHFPGVVLLVSHDRYFMDKIVDHVFVLGEGSDIRDFPGNYTDYKIFKEENLQQKGSKVQSTSNQTELKPSAQSQEDRKELKKLEKQIQKLEEDKKKITEQFNDGSLASEKIMELSQTLKKIQAELDEREMLWLELSE
jgi:ATP-binding cassette subfamily F protein uup